MYRGDLCHFAGNDSDDGQNLQHISISYRGNIARIAPLTRRWNFSVLTGSYTNSHSVLSVVITSASAYSTFGFRGPTLPDDFTEHREKSRHTSRGSRGLDGFCHLCGPSSASQPRVSSRNLLLAGPFHRPSWGGVFPGSIPIFYSVRKT